MVGQHLFLNIIPNNFTATTGRKVWCDRAMSGLAVEPSTFQKVPWPILPRQQEKGSILPRNIPLWNFRQRTALLPLFYVREGDRERAKATEEPRAAILESRDGMPRGPQLFSLTCWEASKAAGASDSTRQTALGQAAEGGRDGKSIIGKGNDDVLHARGVCMSGRRRVEGFGD